MTEEKQNFGADVSRLLEIVAHALYSNRDVFLRELVSNAADACDRLRYEAIQDPALAGADADLKIRIYREPVERLLTVVDNGVGMSRQEMIDNLGTIAKSGTKTLTDQLKGSGDEKEKLSLIGQFGVGFYACFMVSDNVTVISRRAGETQAWRWQSDGRTGFSVRKATDEEAARLTGRYGTAVVVHIDDNSSEFMLDEKLRQVIEMWSDHVGVPIFLGSPSSENPEEEEKPVNKASALWTRPKSEITTEEYEDFYRHIGHGLDEPQMISHWRAEGKIEYTALLFVPTLRPFDLYDPTRRHAVRLYVRRVFISDQAEGLIYPWLRFLRGLVDSSDLPLNVSREMLQLNPVVAKIRSGVTKRVLADLDKLGRDDEAAFATFWGQFGAVLKEGLYDAFEHREEILKVTRFYSTHDDGKLTSLADYLARMKPDQDAIYYISGENIDTLRNSPQIEGFRARGLEVLFFTDTIDDFWLQSVMDYQGKPFKSVTKGDIDLSKFATPEKADAADTVETRADDAAIQQLLGLLKEELKNDVGDVRTTTRLVDSAVCLIAADSEVDLRMERVLRIHQKYEPQSKRVMEVNPKHPLIERLSAMVAASESASILSDAGHMLLDQARIIQGEPVPDPAAFARRMAMFMERGLAA